MEIEASTRPHYWCLLRWEHDYFDIAETIRPSNHSKRSSGSKLPIVIVAIIIAIVALFASVAMSCSNQTKYDWSNLKLENGRMIYYEDGNAVSTTGIDVSDLQGSIDW